MTGPRQVRVTIERLVVDGQIDEQALRAAIAAELGRTLTGAPPELTPRVGVVESAAAGAVADHVRAALIADRHTGPRR
jgi:hypothetical protein